MAYRGRVDCIVSYNAKVNRHPAEVVTAIKRIIKDNPSIDVIVLQEAGEYVHALRGLKGWKVYAKSGWRESMNNPILVRRRISIPKTVWGVNWGVIRCTIPWTGPKEGIKHPGRTFTWVKVGSTWIVSIHRVTGGREKNKKSYLEERDKISQFVWTRAKSSPCVVFGDTNTAYNANYDGSMQDLANRTGGRLVADKGDAGIDYALVKQLRAVVHRTKEYGSDHRAAVLKTM